MYTFEYLESLRLPMIDYELREMTLGFSFFMSSYELQHIVTTHKSYVRIKVKKDTVIIMGANIFTTLSKQFGYDLVLMLKEKMSSQTCFLLNIDDPHARIQMLRGDLSTLGFGNQTQIPLQTVLKLIETNNPIAEVEGKNNFIGFILDKIKRIENDLFLYLPFKYEYHIRWQLYKFDHLFKDHEHHLILGHILKTLDETPDEINYYQKTFQDPMTNLFTKETLKLHLERLTETKDKYIMYLDIDGFKLINDRYGHLSGDKFIKDIANYFIRNADKDVIYYRLGGDEFLVYVKNSTKDEIYKRAQRLIDDISKVNAHAIHCNVSVSVGIVKLSDERKDYYTLLDLGDKTMYQSKNHGRGLITYFE